MKVEFTSHNIRLDDGSLTKPDVGITIDEFSWCVSAKRVMEAVFPGDKSRLTLVDLGCLEGGYSVEFARMGFQVLGVEIRESNFAACNVVKSKTNLPNLKFVNDDAWNIENYGTFDIVFCSGLLYHLDKPKKFLEVLSRTTNKLLILNTHFAIDAPLSGKFILSEMCENEGLRGRWFSEFTDDEAFSDRENFKWAAWDNRKSFWIQREYLLQTIQDVGFDLVAEQFDLWGPDEPCTLVNSSTISQTMLTGYYHTDTRGSFIGIKT